MGNPGNTSIARTAAFASASLTDLVELDDGENGDAVPMTTDNAETVNAHFVDSIKGQIVVTCTDIELSNAQKAVLFIGKTGSLVIAYGRRTQGKGVVAAHTHTITYANAQLLDIKRRAGVTGTGSLVLTFVAYDPAGLAVSTQAVA